ncbi:CPBP family intramembrane glutamic endopeptidase [Lignipirellula cremea]|uniref:CAAX amino terminal protease self-immunity n=1 Tax=Lignipirellula cremea TaxID=2528010 RepID=A0A518DTG7_9BACT|nr:CPBP family intramembrane glutamic endopeptidase [Lignipirellula cremea]QDU95137.1 CAAX amino terminal protease self- immunity [Lignipirellula cremea]
MDTEPPPESPERFVRTAILFEGGLGLIAVIVGWLVGYPPWAPISPEGPAPLAALPAIGWGLAATLPMLAGLVLIDYLPWEPLRHLRQTVEASVLPHFRRLGLAGMLLISLAAGIGEELLFRGVLQAALTAHTDIWWRQAVSLLLASLAFGACHWMTNAYAVIATLIGAYLGWLWLATGNLLAPIACHAAYDFIAMLYLVRGGGQEYSAGQPSTESGAASQSNSDAAKNSADFNDGDKSAGSDDASPSADKK